MDISRNANTGETVNPELGRKISKRPKLILTVGQLELQKAMKDSEISLSERLERVKKATKQLKKDARTEAIRLKNEADEAQRQRGTREKVVLGGFVLSALDDVEISELLMSHLLNQTHRNQDREEIEHLYDRFIVELSKLRRYREEDFSKASLKFELPKKDSEK